VVDRENGAEPLQIDSVEDNQSGDLRRRRAALALVAPARKERLDLDLAPRRLEHRRAGARLAARQRLANS